MPDLPPLQTAEYVDLQKFMGDWYVIANIPTVLEKQAHNAVESYAWEGNGVVATTFTFNKGALDGPKKTYHPTGFVSDAKSNAIWRMQFIWPIKADYRIVYVDEAYLHTIIGREKRDYVWLMSRQPVIAKTEYDRLIGMIAKQGYDITKVRRVPHSPAEP